MSASRDPIPDYNVQDSPLAEEEIGPEHLAVVQNLLMDGIGTMNDVGIVKYSKDRSGVNGEAPVRVFDDDYNLLAQVGSGGYSVVHQCERKTTGEVRDKCAV